jgi:hypothetical protein
VRHFSVANCSILSDTVHNMQASAEVLSIGDTRPTLKVRDEMCGHSTPLKKKDVGYGRSVKFSSQ